MSLDHRTIAAVRFGYGLAPERPGPKDASDLFSQLQSPESQRILYPSKDFRQRIEDTKEKDRWSRTQKAQLTGEALDKVLKAARKANAAELRRLKSDDIKSFFAQRAEGNGFFERLSTFWTDNFSVGKSSELVYAAVDLPTYEIEVIRPHVMGDFRDMLHSVVQSPVMVRYLDQHRSVGPKSKLGRTGKRNVNENLAREILELHTLGVSGPYSQDDVRQFALLLTGFTINRKVGWFEFNRNMSQPGLKRVLGKTYGGPRPLMKHVFEFLDDLAVHPATAEHLCRKLAVHFVSPEPSAKLIEHMKAAYLASNGHLPKVYEALLEHPDAWSGPLAKMKQPIDFIVALHRAANRSVHDLSDKQINKISRWLSNSNQQLWRPNGPDGWPEEESYWLNAAALVGRFKTAGVVAQELSERTNLDPRDFAEGVLGSSLRPTTAFAVAAAETRADGFAMIFASPEFNRR